MGSVSDSMETVNAAAVAIVTAENRVQPSSSVQKSMWGDFWSRYWCFGTHKNTKRISHAPFAPEPTIPEEGTVLPTSHNQVHSNSIAIPFVAPPSSPASFLQSDPSTATQSPGGLIALTSFSANPYSPPGPAHMFAVGPYADETQLVSPPVFSAFPTEPSTAAVTPPPEPVQFTTPSSPEVPFAQLLTNSLNNRVRRHSGGGTIPKHGLSYYDYHQLYSGSPVGQLISPGSVNSTSGTSSPYPVKRPVIEFRMMDASKLFDREKFATRKWGSRLGSGSLTPDGVAPWSMESVPPDNQISEVASLANSENGSPVGESLVDRRVSFELTHEDFPTCLEKRKTGFLQEEVVRDDSMERIKTTTSDVVEDYCELCNREEKEASAAEIRGADFWDDVKNCKHKNSSISLGSIKEFNFNNADKDIHGEPTNASKWWTDEDVERDIRPQESWTFFPLLQPGVS